MLVGMEQRTLVRLAGAAAMVGGVARILSALPWTRDPLVLEASYDAIDVLLLFGVIGIYLVRTRTLGVPGFLLFVLAVAALSFIGGPDSDVFGFSTYRQGAAVLAIALALLGVVALLRRAMPIWAPVCWIASLVAGSAMLFLSPDLGPLVYAVAGILFGAGFVAAGLDLVRLGAPTSRTHPSEAPTVRVKR